MKFKTVCASIAVATSIATGMMFVPQAQVLAQNLPNRPTQAEQANSRASRSLELQWFLGIIPWLKWNRNSNIPNRPTQIDTKQGHNHKEVPVPVLIPGLAALGGGLIRKHRQEQKQTKMK